MTDPRHMGEQEAVTDEADDDLDGPVKSTRWWWSPAAENAFRWKLLYWGTEENCNQAIGLRLPGGVLHVCLNIPLRQTRCRNCQLSMWTMPTEGDPQ